jgi:hypothetical protein
VITNRIVYEQPSLDVEYDYVGIIDALEPHDRTDFRISEQLKALLTGAGVTTALAEVGSGPEMLGALKAFHKEAVSGKRFMLHFVTHGNADGIAAGPDFVDWATMRPFLERIHAATTNSLLLNMSTCKGLHAVKITEGSGPYPFFGLIGAKKDLLVSDALEANRRVYEKWLAGMPVQKLVPETNAEMGREVLFNISSEGFRKLST